jgi:hypothetical protein
MYAHMLHRARTISWLTSSGIGGRTLKFAKKAIYVDACPAIYKEQFPVSFLMFPRVTLHGFQSRYCISSSFVSIWLDVRCVSCHIGQRI